MLWPVGEPFHLTTGLLGAALGAAALCVLLAYLGIALCKLWEHYRGKRYHEID